MRSKIVHIGLVLALLASTISCNVSYLESLAEVDYLSTKQTLTFEEKGLYYPSWDISIRKLQNQSVTKGFTAKEKTITLRIMSIVRFVLNTPEYEAYVLAHTLKASKSASATTTLEKVTVGDVLNSERVLRTVQKTLLETEIAVKDLASGTVGLGIVPPIYLYLENANHAAFPYIMRRVNAQVWVQFASSSRIEDSLEAYAEIGDTLLHEAVHNLGFTHLNGNFDRSVDVAYVMGNAYAATLQNPDFLKKYANEFKKIVPYFEEKYSSYIVGEPAVTRQRSANVFFDTAPIPTHGENGEPLTIIECIIENPEDYSKPFRYMVKNGQRMMDDFIAN